MADLTGKTVLIVRYIRPQEPPATLTTEESIIRYPIDYFIMFYFLVSVLDFILFYFISLFYFVFVDFFDCYKYVSLLPVVPTPHIPGRPPIWTTSKVQIKWKRKRKRGG